MYRFALNNKTSLAVGFSAYRATPGRNRKSKKMVFIQKPKAVGGES